GAVTIIAESFNGKRLNSPNDVVAHPDGSYWFNDPPYGGQLYERTVDAPGGRRDEARAADQRVPLGPEREARSRDHRGSAARSERTLLLAGPQEALRHQHGPRPRRRAPGRQARHARVRRRIGQQAVEPEGVQRFH